MACSQQGRRKGLTASLLQIAHRSLAGMSSGARDLQGAVVVRGAFKREGREATHLINSACASVIAVDAAIFVGCDASNLRGSRGSSREKRRMRDHEASGFYGCVHVWFPSPSF